MTIITPTYNRAYILGQCYRSLCEQTDKRFLWLVIDDGSNDNTGSLVKEWIAENKIRIKYIKKQNGGKASALNAALQKLDTKYAVCLDSDDKFYCNTVELALKQLEIVDNDNNCCGIVALRNLENGSVMGNKPIPKSMKKITAKDIFIKLDLKTEIICFYKSEILKLYRFPEFKGEKFVSPAWMQYMITSKYYYATCWEKLCCCEYISDGLTKNKRSIIINNPNGYRCVKKLSYELSPNLILKIKHGIMYGYAGILSKNNWIKESPHKLLSILLYPLSYSYYLVSKFNCK